MGFGTSRRAITQACLPEPFSGTHAHTSHSILGYVADLAGPAVRRQGPCAAGKLSAAVSPARAKRAAGASRNIDAFNLAQCGKGNSSANSSRADSQR
jgi:hypothetical protein